MPDLITLTQSNPSGTNPGMFSVDGGTTWFESIENYPISLGQRVRVHVKGSRTAGALSYFWAWTDGYKGKCRTIVGSEGSHTYTAEFRNTKRPVNKVVLGSSGDSELEVIMDISDSTLSPESEDEYNHNAVRNGVTYYDNTGVLRTGNNPYTNTLVITSTPVTDPTTLPQWQVTIVTEE